MKPLAYTAMALLAFAGATRADDPAPPAATPPDGNDHATLEEAHRAMHEAMLQHASMPAEMPAMPDHTRADAGTAHDHMMQTHGAAADRAARDRAMRHGHGADAGAPGQAGGMTNGGGMHEGNGGTGGCGDPAGMNRTNDMHPGGMMPGGGGGMPGGGGGGGGGGGMPGGGMP